MNTIKALKIIDNYLKRKLKHFRFIKRLSEFAYTFLIFSQGKTYIVKLVEYKNVATKVIHDKRQMQNIIVASEKINKEKDIKTVRILDIVFKKQYTILLLEKEDIEEIKIENQETFHKLGKAISTFHSACSSIESPKLHWNNFPYHLIRILKEYNRWKEVKKFLYNHFKDVNYGEIVICHNDLHAGNIYFSKNDNVIFLDIDDICKEFCFHDLGMIIANFTTSDFDLIKLKGSVIKLLEGYNKEINRANIKNVILFAIRKLYFVEAYFLYANLIINTKNFDFIEELRKRQNKLKLLLGNY